MSEDAGDLHNDTAEEYLRNITEFIEANLGANQVNWATLISLTVTYTIFLVIGVLGNLATCVVILSNEYLRNATNVYLTNLAIADILTLIVGMPFELYQIWVQYPWTLGDFACDAKVVVTEAIICASILTIVAFSFERYLAICRPLSPLSRSTMGKAKKIILLIWIISFLSAFPWALFTKVNRLVYTDGTELEQSAWCSIPFNEESHGSLYMMMGSTMIYFFAPMVIVTLLYSKIGLTLYRNKMQRCAGSCGGEEGCEAERHYLQGRKTVIRMLVVVVFAFFFCWTPFHSQRLMFVLVTLYGEWTPTLTSVQHLLFTFSGVFFYFNSALNPILYSVMSKRFRRGFADIRTRFLNKLLHLPGAAAPQQSERSGSGKLYPPQGMMPRHWIPKEQRQQILLKVMGPSDQNKNSCGSDDSGVKFEESAAGDMKTNQLHCSPCHQPLLGVTRDAGHWRTESKVCWRSCSDTDTTRVSSFQVRTVSEGGGCCSPSSRRGSSRKSSFRTGLVYSDQF